MIEVGKVERYYSIVVSADVYEADDRAVPYSVRASHYRPSRIEVTYNWTSEDSDQTAHPRLVGPVLYKNGTAGPAKHEDFWIKDSWPDWVREFVEANRPPSGTFGATS